MTLRCSPIWGTPLHKGFAMSLVIEEEALHDHLAQFDSYKLSICSELLQPVRRDIPCGQQYILSQGRHLEHHPLRYAFLPAEY